MADAMDKWAPRGMKGIFVGYETKISGHWNKNVFVLPWDDYLARTEMRYGELQDIPVVVSRETAILGEDFEFPMRKIRFLRDSPDVAPPEASGGGDSPQVRSDTPKDIERGLMSARGRRWTADPWSL